MFTQYNTEGYTDAQLKALNEELEARLFGVYDQEDRELIVKSFADEVSRR